MAGTLKVDLIKNYQNNNSMQINNAGVVTTPVRPAFEAILTVGSGSVQFTTINTEIVFNSTNLNSGSHYNTSTGRFTAPFTGIYFFAMVGMSQGTSWYQFRKNGVALTYPTNPYSTSSASCWAESKMVTTVSLVAGDYVSVFTGAAGSGLYGGGNNHNVFCGHFIG